MKRDTIYLADGVVHSSTFYLDAPIKKEHVPIMSLFFPEDVFHESISPLLKEYQAFFKVVIKGIPQTTNALAIYVLGSKSCQLFAQSNPKKGSLKLYCMEWGHLCDYLCTGT
jgi:hypothetical protein